MNFTCFLQGVNAIIFLTKWGTKYPESCLMQKIRPLQYQRLKAVAGGPGCGKGCSLRLPECITLQ